MRATELQPFLMGILVSVLVGVALTLPISSAAICSVLGLTGLAGGAAVAGCCAQMVGFAVMSFRENRWGGLVSQGLGTSMLQMPNIVKNPRIWIAPTLASAITGPIATCLFKLEMNGAAINSGMGTCGLCGQMGVWTGWVAPSEKAIANGAAAVSPTGTDWLGLVLNSLHPPRHPGSRHQPRLPEAWLGEGRRSDAELIVIRSFQYRVSLKKPSKCHDAPDRLLLVSALAHYTFRHRSSPAADTQHPFLDRS